MKDPLKLIIPEGTEAQIDHENRVVLFNPIKEKEESLPLSVEEVKGRRWIIDDEIDDVNDYCFDRKKKFALSSKSRAEAFLALMQLVELRDAWNGDWRSNWSNVEESKWCICEQVENIGIYEVYGASCVLHFKSKDLAERFLEQFKELIEQAKELI